MELEKTINVSKFNKLKGTVNAKSSPCWKSTPKRENSRTVPIFRSETSQQARLQPGAFQAAGLILKYLQQQLLPLLLLLKALCLGGGVGQQHSAPVSIPWEHQQHLPTLHPEWARYSGQGWPSCVSPSSLPVTLLPPPSPGLATKFLLQLVKVCFLLPADFFFLMVTLNSLHLKG